MKKLMIVLCFITCLTGCRNNTEVEEFSNLYTLNFLTYHTAAPEEAVDVEGKHIAFEEDKIYTDIFTDDMIWLESKEIEKTECNTSDVVVEMQMYYVKPINIPITWDDNVIKIDAQFEFENDTEEYLIIYVVNESTILVDRLYGIYEAVKENN